MPLNEAPFFHFMLHANGLGASQVWSDTRAGSVMTGNFGRVFTWPLSADAAKCNQSEGSANPLLLAKWTGRCAWSLWGLAREMSMDLNIQYAAHQRALMLADSSECPVDRFTHLSKASAIAGQIGAKQRELGAAAACAWSMAEVSALQRM